MLTQWTWIWAKSRTLVKDRGCWRLEPMGLQRVSHDSVTKHNTAQHKTEFGASLVAQMIKSLPAMQETPVRSLGQEDALERGMATHSSILAWRYPWAEDPCRLQSMGLQRVGHNWATRHIQSNLLGFIFSKLLFPNYLFPINFQKHPLTGKIIR